MSQEDQKSSVILVAIVSIGLALDPLDHSKVNEYVNEQWKQALEEYVLCSGPCLVQLSDTCYGLSLYMI